MIDSDIRYSQVQRNDHLPNALPPQCPKDTPQSAKGSILLNLQKVQREGCYHSLLA